MNLWIVILTRYVLILSSMPSSTNFVSFLSEKEYKLVYHAVVWCFFLGYKKYLKIDIYLIHSSNLSIQVSATIT